MLPSSALFTIDSLPLLGDALMNTVDVICPSVFKWNGILLCIIRLLSWVSFYSMSWRHLWLKFEFLICCFCQLRQKEMSDIWVIWKWFCNRIEQNKCLNTSTKKTSGFSKFKKNFLIGRMKPNKGSRYG